MSFDLVQFQVHVFVGDNQWQCVHDEDYFFDTPNEAESWIYNELQRFWEEDSRDQYKILSFINGQNMGEQQ
jgi:hypothetical protein